MSLWPLRNRLPKRRRPRSQSKKSKHRRHRFSMLRLLSAGLYIQLPPCLRLRNKGWSTKHTRLLHHRHTSRKRPAHRLLLTLRKRPAHRLLLTLRKRPAHRLLRTSRKRPTHHLLRTSRKRPTPSRSLIRQPTIKIKRKRTRPKDNSGRHFPRTIGFRNRDRRSTPDTPSRFTWVVRGHFAPPVATSRRKLCTMNSMSSSSLISLKLLSTVTRPCCITLMRSQISKRWV
jgi:hypothetical protein